ncbi:MAG: replicative DNA helicase [Waddliaceae bacterium]
MTTETPTKVKVAPNSKESEMMVLGTMLTSINGLNIAADALNDSDFYYSEHKIVFQVLKSAYKSDKPADIHLVCEELKRQDKLQAVGGVPYVTTLAQYAGTSAHIEAYCRIVHEKSVLRRMIQAAQAIEKEALEQPADVSVTLDRAQEQFFKISQTTSKGDGILLKDILSGEKAESSLPFLEDLQKRQEEFQERGGEAPPVIGIQTHFTDLDKMIQGFGKSNLMILAGRPAMGKTALGLNLIENICFKNGIPSAAFSLEMSAEQLVHRMICSQAEVPSEKLKTGSLNGYEFQRVVEAVNRMQNHSLLIDDQPGLKINDLRARARRFKEVYNIGFLLVDYLQLISGSGSSQSQESRQLEVSEISRTMKNIARELNIPVLCLSQLSRKVEERQGHKPMMSDLRESGSLEQDSDQIFLLFRPEYYDPMNKPGITELIIAKNRHGEIGTVTLTFRKEIAQFNNYSPL